MAIAVGSVVGGERIWKVLGPEKRRSDSIGFDYRIVALGALLPDLIDKPLKWFIVPGSLPDDHVYGHTLLLPLCLILVGLLLARRGDLRLLGFGLGCLTHPLVDPTNSYPKTLFWPIFGTDFPEANQDRGFLQPALEIVVVASGVCLLAWRQGARDFARRFATRGHLT